MVAAAHAQAKPVEPSPWIEALGAYIDEHLTETGVGCSCAPPDTNGEVGATQYVQIVNEGFQVFSKSTGASIHGPAGITTLWSGFGGVCQNNGDGDPVVMKLQGHIAENVMIHFSLIAV